MGETSMGFVVKWSRDDIIEIYLWAQYGQAKRTNIVDGIGYYLYRVRVQAYQTPTKTVFRRHSDLVANIATLLDGTEHFPRYCNDGVAMTFWEDESRPRRIV